MRKTRFLAIVTGVTIALAAGDVWGRPGRGGGGAPGSRPGGAGGASSQRGSNAGGHQGNRPSTGNAKINSPGKLGNNAGSNFSNKFNGQFDKGNFSSQRPNSRQLEQFLTGKGESLKAGEFTRGDKAALSKEQFQAQASQLQSNLQSRADDLFTPQWYAEHPNAWQATHPHADAWAVATAASVAAWINAAAYAGGTDTVVVESGTSDTAPEATEEPTSSEATGTTDAAAIAASDPSQWLSIGVFALAQTGQSEPTTLIQLAVNKQGQLNGSYYDLVSDNGTPVSGQVDTNTERAAWTVGENSKNVFATNIETLTADNGPVTLHLPNGKTQNWNLIRVNKPK
jgi:hypothetical protein